MRKRVGLIATDFSSSFFDPLPLREEARACFPNSILRKQRAWRKPLEQGREQKQNNSIQTRSKQRENENEVSKGSLMALRVVKILINIFEITYFGILTDPCSSNNARVQVCRGEIPSHPQQVTLRL